jgi:hypothetical protein
VVIFEFVQVEVGSIYFEVLVKIGVVIVGLA